MKIGKYSFKEFGELARNFHGYPAPGLMIGGYMVELAKSRLPEGTLFDAIVETRKCLPDAVQLLTLCSIGNGWLKIVNFGRYALSLYDKYSGKGWRVFLDLDKLKDYPEILEWYLKRKPKKDQDSEKLFAQIEQAGDLCLSLQEILVKDRYLHKTSMGSIAICPLCGEAYPELDGAICRGCQGKSPYYLESQVGKEIEDKGPDLLDLPVEKAVGEEVLHDMTRIVPGQSKGAVFTAGQKIRIQDIEQLKKMGRSRIYLRPQGNTEGLWLHENEAVEQFALKMAGPGVSYNLPPKEGKINFLAEHSGLLQIDREKLIQFNLVPDVMCASRQDNSVLEQGKPFAGCRAIPLYLNRDNFSKAMSALGKKPLFRVQELRKMRAGVLITGTEVHQGLVQDRFLPVIQAKLNYFDCPVRLHKVVPDDQKKIVQALREMLDQDLELIITTAGLSVDPDDVTRKALLQAGLKDYTYGAPILPGAMTLLGWVGQARIIGVPACALFFKTTSFDLVLPRVLAGVEISKRDLAEMAEGAFCLNCKSCTFPKCPFGK